MLFLQNYGERGVGQILFPTPQRFRHHPTGGAKQNKARVIPGFIFVITFDIARQKKNSLKESFMQGLDLT